MHRPGQREHKKGASLYLVVEKLASLWIGRMVRRKLGLKTEKRHGSYVVAATEGPKLARLYEKYGVSTSPGDLGDFAGGMEPSRDAPII